MDGVLRHSRPYIVDRNSILTIRNEGPFPMPLTTSQEPSGPRVIEAERIAGGIMITFDDGEYAFFSPDLLYRSLLQAHRPIVSPEE